MGDPGEGPGGPNPPLIFKTKGRKKIFATVPPLSQDLNDRPPPPPSLSEGLDLPLRKAYEVTAARTSGRVNFSFSRQTGFSHPFFLLNQWL